MARQTTQAAEQAQPVELIAEPVAPPQPFIADDSTMTVYDRTLGEIIEGVKGDVLKINADHAAELEKKQSVIFNLHMDVGVANSTIDRLTKELQAEKDKFSHAAWGDRMKKDGNGGLSLRLVVPIEIAQPFLSQAEGANEDPETFIRRQIDEALLAYSMS